MINPEKIEEWIREVEERPDSAPFIIRHIANRLGDLASWNEELLAENIELRTGRRVEEYEGRIANLEYQVELLKRQLGGEISAGVGLSGPQPLVDAVSLLVFNPQGQVLRVGLRADELVSGDTAASFKRELLSGGEAPRLLVTTPAEELLMIFDSGRTAVMPVAEVPAAERDGLNWGHAYLQETRGNEEVSAVLPIARMSLFEFCLQISRKGFVKKVRENFLESYIANSFLGTGTKLKSDRTCSLVFCGSGDLLVMASREGFLMGIEADRLPLTIEEIMRPGLADYIVSTWIAGEKPSILAVTQNGKAIHRDTGWLEPATSFKGKGQPLFSKERRASGVRLAGAAGVDEEDWGAALHSDGKVTLHRVGDLFATGSILSGQPEVEIMDFTTFRLPETMA